MNYKPPYWHHDNIKLNSEEIEELKNDIENINFDRVKNDSNLSTYFLDETNRPEAKYNELYSNVVENITKKVGIFYKVKYRYGYWSQLYKKDMLHRPHHHASLNTKLLPGDILGSGTVGTGCILELRPENTGGWLKSGDTVRLEIDGLGTLENKIK